MDSEIKQIGDGILSELQTNFVGKKNDRCAIDDIILSIESIRRDKNSFLKYRIDYLNDSLTIVPLDLATAVFFATGEAKDIEPDQTEYVMENGSVVSLVGEDIMIRVNQPATYIDINFMIGL